MSKVKEEVKAVGTVEETAPAMSDHEIAMMLFAQMRHFEIVDENGIKRKAELRIPTIEEEQQAKIYALSVIQEKTQDWKNPITGKTVPGLPTRDNMMEWAKKEIIGYSATEKIEVEAEDGTKQLKPKPIYLWSEDDDIQFASLETNLRSKIEQIVKGKMAISRGYNLSMEILQHRRDIHPYNQRRWDIYSRTADAAGEEALHKYLCVATAIWEDTGDRIFDNIAAFEKTSNIRNQVYAQYMILMRMENDYNAPLDTEIGWLRDWGFLDINENIYDYDKKNVVLNLKGGGPEGDERAEFYDDEGNVLIPPGIMIPPKAEESEPE